MILNLGCGRAKALPAWASETGGEVVHVDAYDSVEPDVLCDLGVETLPLAADTVDAVYAIHVLEHIGQQGELGAWFHFWEDLYRVLKPGAKVYFESPYHSSVWAWADPTHTRAISDLTFLYLAQDSYRVGGSIPDYRPPFDFVLDTFTVLSDFRNLNVLMQESLSMIRGILRAQKPLRPYWYDIA